MAAEVGRFVTASRHRYDAVTIDLLAYEATLADGEWTLASHDAAEWVEPEELLEYELAPADVPIAKRLADEPAG